jgi:hypothetical protein
MLNAIKQLDIPNSPVRKERAAQALASATLFLAGYGLAGIMFDLFDMVSRGL